MIYEEKQRKIHSEIDMSARAGYHDELRSWNRVFGLGEQMLRLTGAILNQIKDELPVDTTGMPYRNSFRWRKRSLDLQEG